MSGRYVPPHLRGRGNSSGNSNIASSASSPARTSRWASNPSNSTATSTSPDRNSRWGNVDPSLRGPAPARRSGPPPFNSADRMHQLSGPKVAFFGDSFVRLFGLIDKPTVKVRGFKGASAKGLGREGNENRGTITSFVEGMGSSVERLVFVFGSVDVHLSFYYMKYVKQQDIDLESIAEKYVDFVADLPSEPSVVKTVVGVYFSPLEDADVGPSLHSYGSLTEEQAALVSESDDAHLQNRQERVMLFNRVLKKRCEERNVKYCDINTEMADSETLVIKDAYKDVSNHNIHIGK